jgi:multidrug efflux pump
MRFGSIPTMASLGVTPLDVRPRSPATISPGAGQVRGDFMQTNIDAKTSLDDPSAFGAGGDGRGDRWCG